MIWPVCVCPCSPAFLFCLYFLICRLISLSSYIDLVFYLDFLIQPLPISSLLKLLTLVYLTLCFFKTMSCWMGSISMLCSWAISVWIFSSLLEPYEKMVGCSSSPSSKITIFCWIQGRPLVCRISLILCSNDFWLFWTDFSLIGIFCWL